MKADTSQPFRVLPVDYQAALTELRAVRETVFVQEQNVPLEEEWDALDPQCVHVMARALDGTPIGTGRLIPPYLAAHGWAVPEPGEQAGETEASPDMRRTRFVENGQSLPRTRSGDSPFSTTARIGRMAVLREWRGKGVGDALLLALIEQARQRGWREVALNSQVSAIGFYLRHGFVPAGERFREAGIEHQAMRRALAGASAKIHAVEQRVAAVAMVSAIIAVARRGLWIYSRELDPGLLDAPEVVDALRRFATAGRGNEARILLQDAAAPQRAHAPLPALAQRLPSALLFREVTDPVDRAYPSAFVANDRGGYYFRSLGHRFDGEATLDAPGRARQLREGFDRVWERSRPVSEYRALEI